MIHVEKGRAQLEGNIQILANELCGLFEALNRYFNTDREEGMLLFSVLFSAKGENGEEAPVLEFVRNLNKRI